MLNNYCRVRLLHPKKGGGINTFQKQPVFHLLTTQQTHSRDKAIICQITDVYLLIIACVTLISPCFQPQIVHLGKAVFCLSFCASNPNLIVIFQIASTKPSGT